ncbi:hypothetical protein HG530_010363 [Fusarium avenaceum]|nr:hypothetical protein HG530_010363 [Fusarium avenaceum]
MRLDRSVAHRTSGVVAADEVELLRLDSGQAGSDGVSLISTEEIALELVKNKLQNLLVGALLIILTLVDLVGDEAEVSGDQVGDG